MSKWKVASVTLFSLLFLAPIATAARIPESQPPIVVLGDEPKVGGYGCG